MKRGFYVLLRKHVLLGQPARRICGPCFSEHAFARPEQSVPSARTGGLAWPYQLSALCKHAGSAWQAALDSTVVQNQTSHSGHLLNRPRSQSGPASSSQPPNPATRAQTATPASPALQGLCHLRPPPAASSGRPRPRGAASSARRGARACGGLATCALGAGRAAVCARPSAGGPDSARASGASVAAAGAVMAGAGCGAVAWRTARWEDVGVGCMHVGEGGRAFRRKPRSWTGLSVR